MGRGCRLKQAREDWDDLCAPQHAPSRSLLRTLANVNRLDDDMVCLLRCFNIV